MDGMTGGMMGGFGVDPMARFLPTQTSAPMANAANMGSQAAMMRASTPQPGLLSQIGQAAGRFGSTLGAMQQAMPQQQPMQPLGLAQVGAQQMPMGAGMMPQQQQRAPTADYMAMLDQIIAGAFD